MQLNQNHRPGMAIGALALVAASLPCASTAQATMDQMRALLHEAEVAARPASTLRADGNLVINVPGQAAARHQVALLQRQNGDLYLELHDTGLKALVLDGGQRAYILTPGTSEPRPCKLDEQVAGSDFTCEDLAPFTASHYETPQIADRSSRQMTITLVPRKSHYSLLVLTIDTDKKTPVKTMYYVETLNNLVKMRRDRELVRVDGRWRPQEITMQHFQLRTHSVLELTWSTLSSTPLDLFRPDLLARPSELKWPARATQTP